VNYITSMDFDKYTIEELKVLLVKANEKLKKNKEVAVMTSFMNTLIDSSKNNTIDDCIFDKLTLNNLNPTLRPLYDELKKQEDCSLIEIIVKKHEIYLTSESDIIIILREISQYRQTPQLINYIMHNFLCRIYTKPLTDVTYLLRNFLNNKRYIYVIYYLILFIERSNKTPIIIKEKLDNTFISLIKNLNNKITHEEINKLPQDKLDDLYIERYHLHRMYSFFESELNHTEFHDMKNRFIEEYSK